MRKSTRTVSGPVKRSRTRATTKLVKARTFPLKRNPLPPLYYSTLKYCEYVTISLSAGGFNYYVMSANGLYDPNISGTGHQPMYFDQMMALYNHYHVRASRCSVDSGASNDLQTATMQQLVVEDDATLATTSSMGISAMTEMPGKQGAVKVMNTADTNLPTLKANWRAKDVFSGDLMANNALRGNSGANPSEQSYYIYGIYDANGNSITYVTAFTIEYDVVFSEYKGVGQS